MTAERRAQMSSALQVGAILVAAALAFAAVQSQTSANATAIFLWHGGSEPFGWIAADNEVVSMDAQTVFAFGQAAAAVETRLIFAARALREMDPIPENFTDDAWWG